MPSPSLRLPLGLLLLLGALALGAAQDDFPPMFGISSATPNKMYYYTPSNNGQDAVVGDFVEVPLGLADTEPIMGFSMDTGRSEAYVLTHTGLHRYSLGDAPFSGANRIETTATLAGGDATSLGAVDLDLQNRRAYVAATNGGVPGAGTYPAVMMFDLDSGSDAGYVELASPSGSGSASAADLANNFDVFTSVRVDPNEPGGGALYFAGYTAGSAATTGHLVRCALTECATSYAAKTAPTKPTDISLDYQGGEYIYVVNEGVEPDLRRYSRGAAAGEKQWMDGTYAQVYTHSVSNRVMVADTVNNRLQLADLSDVWWVIRTTTLPSSRMLSAFVVDSCGNANQLDEGEECDGTAAPLGLVCTATCSYYREDPPCDNAFGLDCSCPTAAAAPAGSPDPVSVEAALANPGASAQVDITVSSGSTGALEYAGRTTTKTEVRVTVQDGLEWSLATDSPAFGARLSASLALVGDKIYTGSGLNGAYQHHTEIYSSADAGATWTQVTASANPTGDSGTRQMVYNADTSTMFMLGGGDHTSVNNPEIFSSTGDFDTWTRGNPTVTTGSGLFWGWRNEAFATCIPSSAGGGAQGTLVFGGGLGHTFTGTSGTYVHQGDIWRSTDNGATWERTYTNMDINVGWGVRRSVPLVVRATGSGTHELLLVGGAVGPQTIFKNDVWVSTDAGTTWTERNAGAPWTARWVHSVVVQPTSGNVFVMAGVGGGQALEDVWSSPDGGLTWTEVTTSKAWGTRANVAAIALANDAILILGGSAGGNPTGEVYKFADLGNTHGCTVTLFRDDFTCDASKCNIDSNDANGPYACTNSLTLTALEAGCGGYDLSAPALGDGSGTATSVTVEVFYEDSGVEASQTASVSIVDTCSDGYTVNTAGTVCVADATDDPACDAGLYGLGCTCNTASAAVGQVDVATLAVAVSETTGDITLTAGGNLARAARTVTRTTLEVPISGGSCSFNVMRESYTCGGDGCGDCTATVTLAELQAGCAGTLATETYQGDTVLRVDSTLFYSDELTDAFGAAATTATHTASTTVYIKIGASVEVKGSNTGSVRVADIQVSSTLVTPSTGDGDGDAEMDITLLITMDAGSSVETSGATAVTDAAATQEYTSVAVQTQADGTQCTATRCVDEIVVRLVENAAECDFSGAFKLAFSMDHGSGAVAYEFVVTVVALAGTDACSATTVGTSGTALSIVSAATSTMTGILGSAGGSLSLVWTSRARLDGAAAEDDDLDSTLDSVQMVLQSTEGGAPTCDGTTTGTEVYTADNFANDGGSLVAVADEVQGKSQTITLTLATEDLGELNDIGASADFASLASTYVAQICVIVTRTAQVGVQLPTRRLTSATARRLGMSAAKTETEASQAGGAGTGSLTIAAAGEDTSIAGSIRLVTTTTLAGEPSLEVQATIAAAVKSRLALALHLPAAGVVVGSVSRAGPTAVEATFRLIVPRVFSAATVAQELDSLLVDMSTSPATSALGSSIDNELILSKHTRSFATHSGSARRDEGPITHTDGELWTQPWVLAVAGGAFVTVVAAIVVKLHSTRTTAAGKASGVTRVQSISIKPVNMGLNVSAASSIGMTSSSSTSDEVESELPNPIATSAAATGTSGSWGHFTVSRAEII